MGNFLRGDFPGEQFSGVLDGGDFPYPSERIEKQPKIENRSTHNTRFRAWGNRAL